MISSAIPLPIPSPWAKTQRLKDIYAPRSSSKCEKECLQQNDSRDNAEQPGKQNRRLHFRIASCDRAVEKINMRFYKAEFRPITNDDKSMTLPAICLPARGKSRLSPVSFPI